MSLFGKLDAANIPTNPFFIEAGEYTAEVTKALYKQNRDDVKQLVLTYAINDENSEYFDTPVSQYFTLVDPGMTQEEMNLLPSDEKKKIRQNNASLKRTLCGNANNEKHKGLGVDIDDLNDENWDPQILVGTKVNIAISNYGNGKTKEGVNIRWVNIPVE